MDYSRHKLNEIVEKLTQVVEDTEWEIQTAKTNEMSTMHPTLDGRQLQEVEVFLRIKRTHDQRSAQ